MDITILLGFILVTGIVLLGYIEIETNATIKFILAKISSTNYVYDNSSKCSFPIQTLISLQTSDNLHNLTLICHKPKVYNRKFTSQQLI